jgi:glycogen(starch) synthase
VEAALMARPVIASRVGGLKEVVMHGETGFLVEKDDPDALAGYLRDMLIQPELMMRLGARARTAALERFGMEKNVACYAELYRKVMKASRK